MDIELEIKSGELGKEVVTPPAWGVGGGFTNIHRPR